MARRAALLALLLAATPVVAQRNASVPDPDPELERKTFQLAEGFEATLFAADPQLAKPIQMNFDPRGRLWVAASEVYPQIKPGESANDKILILEDSTGDGKADKTRVFADGLLIPSGVLPGDGGVYVAASTELLHFTDTTGDGKADRVRVVLSGFGTEDTHHTLHTLRWCPDGSLAMNQSVYIHSHVETPHGVRRLNGGGVWLYRPETGRLEVFTRGLWNPWGHHHDRWGQSFQTDGAGGEGVNVSIPGAYYAASPGAARVLRGLNPGHPKYCGLEIVSGRHLPDDWQGNLITCDFRGHRVCRFLLQDDGAGFAARQLPDLIRSNHPAFRPIDVKMGPDGAIYVADWYNPIIQHGEVDFRDPRRDRVHGRIWRITAKGRPLVPKPNLSDAATPQLLAALTAPEQFTREQARRLLKERGSAVLNDVPAWLATQTGEHPRVEALWLYQSLDVPEPKLLAGLLEAKEPRAREAATRVLADWGTRVPDAVALLAKRALDDAPRVRLEAVRGLGKLGTRDAADAALKALDKPMDGFLDYALWLTARETEAGWLQAAVMGERVFDGQPRRMLFAAEAVRSPTVVPLVEAVLSSGKLSAEDEQKALLLLSALGGAAELNDVLNRALTADTDAARQTRLLAALEQAARQRGAKPAEPANVKPLLAAKNAEIQAAAARLAGLWKVESLRGEVERLARTAETPEAVRVAALDGVAAFGGPAAQILLTELAAHPTPTVRRQAVVALAALDLPAAAKLAAERFEAELIPGFVQRRGGPDILAAALTDRKLAPDVARQALAAARSGGPSAKPLVAVLEKAVAAGPVKRQLSPAEMAALVEEVRKAGDPARGELVYRRAELNCQKCHAIAGAGGLVGPDLTSIGGAAQIDYLIESLLLPSKAIKENYHSLVVSTVDGKFFTGIKVKESATELVLRTADDKEISIPAKDVEEKQQGASLMPEGLTDNLSRGDLVDLVRFLSELGKVGPYSVSPARVARRWQALAASPEALEKLAASPAAAVLADDPAWTWEPAYSTVGGMLPIAGLPRLTPRGGEPAAFVRCQIAVTTGGPLVLKLSGAQRVLAWLGAAQVALAADEATLDLKPGTHTLTLAVPERGGGKGMLRLELADVPGAATRATFVGGK